MDVALTQALVAPAGVPAGAPAAGLAAPDADCVVVVVDVIRATTVLCVALASGATGVRTVGSVEEARRLAAAEGALLVGERGGLPPPGFDLGNSPADFTPAVCAGRSIVLTTTNGTAAVERCAGAGRMLAACLLNVEATARSIAAGPQRRVLVVCAGSGGEVALDDVVAAGCLVGNLSLLAAAVPGDAARVAAACFDTWKHDLHGMLRRSRSGRNLAAVGLLSDLEACAHVDSLPLVAERDALSVFRRVPS